LRAGPRGRILRCLSKMMMSKGEIYMTAAPHPSAAGLPVRPGEDPWTADEVAEVRAELETEAAALRKEIGQVESEIADHFGDMVAQAGDDEADASSKVTQREHDLALNLNARELLAQTEHGLARIDAGTYGECESCGKPVGKARLQAFPRATLCVECKQREERR
jgi:DnaK suppressor protein